MLTHVFRYKHVAPPAWCFSAFYSQSTSLLRRHRICEGRTTQHSQSPLSEVPSRSPYYFDTGYSAFAKRPARPFPPPFLSRPSGSFSDPLTTFDRAKYRNPKVDGEQLRGITNGDDAILIGGENFLIVNDGVGAWAQKERGHAALWSRLIAHYWSAEAEKSLRAPENKIVSLDDLSPIECLETAYKKTKIATNFPTNETKEATTTTPEDTKDIPSVQPTEDVDSTTSPSNEIMGTTTASSALLHHRSKDKPVVLVTTLGDCAIFIIRPKGKEVIYKSKEQWHWFDCPRQLGTRSPDTPKVNAVTDIVDVQIDDVVVAMSDGVTDNLWEHEICDKVVSCLQKWRDNEKEAEDGVVYVARELMNAAREVAEDPYAESPYMERALDEGIPAEGGKLDDISVIIGLCQRRDK